MQFEGLTPQTSLISDVLPMVPVKYRDLLWAERGIERFVPQKNGDGMTGMENTEAAPDSL